MARLSIIGLSGGIGSGKSTVAGMFKKLGARILDADRIAHTALAQPRIIKEVIRTFQNSRLIDEKGAISRGEMAALVFRVKKNLLKLNRIVHPFVLKTIEKKLTELRKAKNRRLVVIDAPLLFETGLDRTCDMLVYVGAEPAKRLKRVQTARNWTKKQLIARENRQTPVEYKKKHSQLIIDNSGTLSHTFQQVKDIFNFMN